MRIDCRNLIGDTIYSIAPLRLFLAEAGPAELVTGWGPVTDAMVERAFPGLCISRGKEAVACDLSLSAGKISEKFCRSPVRHLTLGYAAALAEFTLSGLEPSIQECLPPDTTWKYPADGLVEHVLIAPFSASCPGRVTGVKPLKLLPEYVWEMVYRDVISRYGLPVRVVAGPGERFRGSLAFLPHLTAVSLRELQRTLERAEIVFAIDNGIGHLAAALGVRMVSFWPEAVNREFIAPMYRRATFVAIGKPDQVKAHRLVDVLKAHLKNGEFWNSELA
jgi:hypothetical protein